MNTFKSFDDLEFKPHPNSKDGVWASLRLSKDIRISVIAGPSQYGSVESELYEVAVLYKEDYVPLQISSDVLGWQSKNQINHLMALLQMGDGLTDSWLKGKYTEKAEWQKEIYS